MHNTLRVSGSIEGSNDAPRPQKTPDSNLINRPPNTEETTRYSKHLQGTYHTHGLRSQQRTHAVGTDAQMPWLQTCPKLLQQLFSAKQATQCNNPDLVEISTTHSTT
jgi:hypothetical protein